MKGILSTVYVQVMLVSVNVYVKACKPTAYAIQVILARYYYSFIACRLQL